MGALHTGLELDFIYKVLKNLNVEGMVSIGDWRWNKVATATVFDDNGSPVDTVKFDPRGVRVGDAAQRSYAVSMRYEPIKRLYIKPQFTMFTHNFANYTPDGLQIVDLTNDVGPNIGRQSWRMPNYGMLDLNTGYSLMINKIKLDLRLSVINILDAEGITDAQSNQFGNTSSFNAASSSVNFLLGRRWQSSLTLTF
jgi:outer membrane receptor protein involved in Fe transport